MQPGAKNTTSVKTQGAGFHKNAMNGQQNHHPYAPEERPPPHFFSNSYKKASPEAMAGTGTRMPMTSGLDMRHDPNLAGAGRYRQEELMHNVRRMRGGGHLSNAASVALAQRRMIPPMAMMGNGQRLPPTLPSGPIIVGGGVDVGISNEHENDDATALRTESIDHIIAFQEAQALRNQELEQLRQLEFIRAVNQRRIKEEMMLAEHQHQHHLRRQQLYPPTHVAGGTSRSISDEELMSRQARLSQFQFMPSPTDELLARVGSKLSGDEHSMSQLQGGFQRGIDDRTVSSVGGMKSPHLAHHVSSESFASVVDDFGQPRPQYYMPPSTLTSRSNSRGQTTATAAPPLRFWNNGVEVDIRGTPLAASLNRLNSNSSNSATSTAATRTSATTSSSSPPDVNVNIVSQFSKLVISCVPELNSAISHLLSEVMQVDPLIVHSKFPGFVGSALLELKSLGERSKDKEDLHKRITNCVAAIEPYKSKNELGESSVHAQIRAIVEEGTERASDLILKDPSERRAKEKKKTKKEVEMRSYGDGNEGDSSVSKKKNKRRRRDSSLSSSETIDFLGMYMDHKYKVEEEIEMDDLTAAAKESSETPLPRSSDEGTSNTKEVEKKNSSSSPSNTTTEPKGKNTSLPPVKKRRISGPSLSSDSSSSEHLQAKSKSNVVQGPHSSLLRQIFGNGNGGGDSGNTTTSYSSTNINAAANQKKADDNTLSSGHLSVASVLLELGR